MKRSTVLVMMTVLAVLLSMTQNVDSWRFRLRRYWRRIKPKIVPILINGVIKKGRSVGENEGDQVARSLEMDLNSEEFRQLREIVEEDADDLVTAGELNSVFD